MSMELPNNGLYYNIGQLPFAETLTGNEVVEIIQNGKSTKVLVSSLRGDQGVPGNDAYIVAVNNGFVGSRTEWLATLVGPRGQTGPAGPKGDTGAQGSTGIQGIVGPQGDKGATGPQGPVGPQGNQGIQGPVGPAGKDGPKGDPGATGAPGVQGPQGPQGPAGKDGDQGLIGPVGPQGPKGDQGAAGAVGIQGVKGDTGPQGPVGPAGDSGGGGGGNSTIIYASGSVPDDAIGNNGDTLIGTDTRHLYEKINNKWVFKMAMASYGAIGTLTFDEVVQVAPAGGPVKITAIPMKANGSEIGNRFNMNPCSTIRISGIATYCRNYEWSNAGTPERKNTVDSWNVELLIACDELCNVKVLHKDITPHMYGRDDVAANHGTLDVTLVNGHWVSAADTTPTNFGTLGYFTVGIDSTNLNEELSVSPAKIDGRFNFAHADASRYGLGSSHLKIQS